MTGFLAILFALNLSACDRIGGPDAAGDGGDVRASLIVQPDTASTSVGDTVQFDARVVDGSGSELSGYSYSWSVSDTTAATVDDDGTLVSRASGNTELTVEATDSNGSSTLSRAAPVAVTPRRVARVIVSPSSPTIGLGDTVQLAATVTSADGEELDRNVRWSSSDTSVVRAGEDGTITGEGEGQASVSARASKVADTAGVSVDLTPAASVNVTPDSTSIAPGATTQLEATVRDSAGNDLERTVSWSSSNTSVATVDALGQVQAQVEGDAVITARSGEASGTSQIVVESSASVPAMPSSVSVSEDSRTDTTVQYTAGWSESDGADTYSWSAGSNSGSWSESGSGVTALQTSFTAPRSSAPDSSYFCVNAVNEAGESDNACTGFAVPAVSDTGGTTDTVVADVSVSPQAPDVEVGNSVQLSATVTNSSGEELSRSVSWSSSNTSVATVDGSGLVSGQAEGTADIVAEVDGVADTASLEVHPEGYGADPMVVEDFSTYSSTSDMMSDPRDIYRDSEDISSSEILLDTTEGLDVSGYSLSQSMRYTFSQGVGTVSRGLNLPSDLNEVWIEVWVKFSPNFRTDWGDPDAAADYKFVFAVTNPGRFELKTGKFGNQYSAGAPQNPAIIETTGASEEWDGEWHRYRLHFAHESSNGACDGTVEFWVDNKHHLQSVGDVCTSRDLGPMIFIALGRNINHADYIGEKMHLWWGRIAYWTSDPAW